MTRQKAINRPLIITKMMALTNRGLNFGLFDLLQVSLGRQEKIHDGKMQTGDGIGIQRERMEKNCF